MENTRRLKNVSLRNSLNNGRQLLFISTHCATWQINESTLPLPNACSGSIKPTTLPLWTDGSTALSYKVFSCAENIFSCCFYLFIFVFDYLLIFSFIICTGEYVPFCIVLFLSNISHILLRPFELELV